MAARQILDLTAGTQQWTLRDWNCARRDGQTAARATMQDAMSSPGARDLNKTASRGKVTFYPSPRTSPVSGAASPLATPNRPASQNQIGIGKGKGSLDRVSSPIDASTSGRGGVLDGTGASAFEVTGSREPFGMDAYLATKRRLKKLSEFEPLHAREFRREHAIIQTTDPKVLCDHYSYETEGLNAHQKRRALAYEATNATIEAERVSVILEEREKIEERRSRMRERIKEARVAKLAENATLYATQLAESSFVPALKVLGTAPEPSEPEVRPRAVWEEEEDERAESLDDARGLTYRPHDTFRSYFVDHSRAIVGVGEGEIRGGRGKREAGLARETKAEVRESLAELDDFDNRIGYFHAVGLKQRMRERGWHDGWVEGERVGYRGRTEEEIRAGVNAYQYAHRVS